jgi:hypothetical protein
MMTNISPTEKTNPVRSRTTPYGSALVPALTVVAKIAPNEINAPAKTPSTSKVVGSVEALLTPLSSARRAIVAGIIASNVTV